MSEIELQVEDRDVKSLKYLGVVFDKNLKMTERIKQVTVGANDVATKLVNIGEPRFSNDKGKVTCGAVNSTVLYGVPIWGAIMAKEKYRNMRLQVQRKMAPRVISAHKWNGFYGGSSGHDRAHTSRPTSKRKVHGL